MGYAVRFDGVTKRYMHGPRYASLRDQLTAAIRGIGARLGGQRREARGMLALDDVSFEVAEGDSFALIGANGAGKTTALKLVSRISYPTRGAVRVRGRVGALIELGSGVHPELTARENIWLYARIQGMTKSEVRRRFDEIVEFAELGHVLDTPVKMYSSGMQLRLGFAIASHLERDIFVVDEALAVGDAGFQAKCVERMTKVVAEGCTLMFVSHNLSAVETICRRGILLSEGRIVAEGAIRDVLRRYIDWIDESERLRRGRPNPLVGRGLRVDRVSVHDTSGEERYIFQSGEPIEIRAEVTAEYAIERPWFSFGINDGQPASLVLCSMLEGHSGFDLAPGRHVVQCHVGPLPLGPRTYDVWMSVRESAGAADLVDWMPVSAIRVSLPPSVSGPSGLTSPWLYGPVRVSHSWSLTPPKP